MGHQVLAKAVWSAIVMMLLTVVLVISCSEGRAEAEKEPIVFSDLNWTSAQFQNRVAQYIVEEGYGDTLSGCDIGRRVQFGGRDACRNGGGEPFV